MGDIKAETNGGSSFIAIVDIDDLLRGQAARMGSLHYGVQLQVEVRFYLPGIYRGNLLP